MSKQKAVPKKLLVNFDQYLPGWRVGLTSLKNLRKALDLKVALKTLEKP